MAAKHGVAAAFVDASIAGYAEPAPVIISNVAPRIGRTGIVCQRFESGGPAKEAGAIAT